MVILNITLLCSTEFAAAAKDKILKKIKYINIGSVKLK